MKYKTQSGFTIVELLIVVVVIAILAAITIVSYNGITQQANASAAKSTAATFQKKAELFFADQGRYPLSPVEIDNSSEPYHLTTGFYQTGSGGTRVFGVTAPNSTDGKNTVRVLKCGSGTPANQAAINSGNFEGLRIDYFNYESGSGFTSISMGTTSGGTVACPTTAS
jgi:prepilin-type N-terminal cleavage/methylation domain-containing protein